MPESIYFFKADVAFRFQGKSKISHWIKKVVKHEDCSLVSLNIVFCSDGYLLNINRDYLKHDYLTDIITFDYSEGKKLSGEIYISIDRVRDNAKGLNLPFEIELRRVIIHGVLHLLGYKDKTASQKKTIRKKEDDCLALFKVVPRGTGFHG
jgi:probable rRNA maturation factor